MVSLTEGRQVPVRLGKDFNDPVAAGAVIFTGALCCLNLAGLLVAASTAADLTPRGVAQRDVDNSGGADGTLSAETAAGIYPFQNSAGADLIARPEIGDTVFIVDDQTVAKTDGGGARSAAGKCVDVDDLGVWVSIG